jgi:DNA-binding NtrC family response regulator
MIDIHHNFHPVLRNLVRMYAYEYLLKRDPELAPVFPPLFAAWLPIRLKTPQPDRHPVHRLCDFLWGHFSQGLERSSPQWITLDNAYGHNHSSSHNGHGELKEPEPQLLYAVEDSNLTMDEARGLLESEGFTGRSAAWQKVVDEVALALCFSFPVLIEGEEGVGKRRLARLIHRLGSTGSAPLIFTTASEMNGAQLESRLRISGSLVLVEIGELDGRAQTDLLRLIREQAASRRVRLIPTSSTSLEQATLDGGFDRELFHHLALLKVTLPPLRNRLEDLPDLVEFFTGQCRDANRNLVGEQFGDAAMERLMQHAWSGNIRELQTVISHTLAGCKDRIVAADEIRFEAGLPGHQTV